MGPDDYVRVCPVCERENAPQLARCVCGAALGGVDFSLKRPTVRDAEAPEASNADERASPERGTSVTAAPAASAAATTEVNIGSARAASAAASADAAASTAATADVNIGSAGAASTAATADAAASAAATADVNIGSAGAGTDAQATIACPHPDCGEPNSVDRVRCIYCNRLLRTEAAGKAAATARPLPSALRDDYRVIDAFPAAGSEADLLLVEKVSTGEQCVAKLYRKGIAPDLRLLRLLAEASGDYVVRLFAHGISDGVAYEVQEYLRHGTLRQILAAGPLPVADVRRIVNELADALNTIHAQHILHRDLKPDNVLVRSFEPLELALSDFGTASLREATQHFTGGARTAKYAAPEALTGVLDDKADWWALGMIALEAASGQHPFAGLSEHVINHHLATRPIDVRAVYDDRLRALCRGLLLRDPKRRWGGAEVARWLAGDTTLSVPDDDGAATSVRPYRIGQVECTTAAELAIALARHWEAGVKDLARGQIARWIEQDLHDHNLVRKLSDIADRHGLSDDMRLLRFLLVAVPDLPPVWQGAAVTAQTLLDAARKAATDAFAPSVRWLDSIAHEQVLARFAQAEGGELADIDRQWRDAWAHFLELWQSAHGAQIAWRKEPKPVAGVDSARVTDVDGLMYSASLWQAPPRQARINGPLLLALFDPDFVDGLHDEIVSARAQLAGLCPWFDRVAEAIGRDPVAAVVAHQMLPQAREDADAEKRRQRATEAARLRTISETRAALHTQLDDIQRIAAADKELGVETIAKLFSALERLQQICHQAMAMGCTEADYLVLSRGAEKLSAHALAAQQALSRCEQLHGVNAVFLRPERLAIAGTVAIGILALRVPWLIMALLLVAVCLFGYGWYLRARTTHAAKAALRWLQLHAKTIDPTE